MGIPSGTKLGSYQVTGAIGAGGMGEVYRAQDTKLSRDVAIKVLPEAFAHDPERLSRFQREAKMLAALNHPNIATIYGLEQSGDTSYLVMELVPGETLAEKIRRGAIPVVESLAITRQMAEALEAAHEKGIVHRDLKPANVKVTPEGKVKVLDFGLAKAFADDGTSQDMDNSPTMSAAATMQGLILGTAGYMSPEQARGKPVDRRADIWAFGVVLYEMVTGKQLFAGETITDTLAQVITREPAWDEIPARMQPLLRWCLEKDPKKRLRDIADGMILLDAAPDQEVNRPAASAYSIWPWAFAAVACLVASGLGALLILRKAPPAPEVFALTLRLPENVKFTRSAQLALSPDGRRIAFPVVGPDGKDTVWVQDMDGAEARSLTGTDPVTDPTPFFWSPDSRYVVFASPSKVRKVDVLSGTIQDICDRPALPVGGSWNRDGVIILGSGTTALWRVSADGGTPVPLTALDPAQHQTEHELPMFLPDGHHFIYFGTSSVADESGVYAGSLDDAPDHQNKKRLLASRFGAVYAPSAGGGPGHLLYLRDGVVMAQSFDADKLQLLGEPAEVADRVGYAYETGHFAVSPTVLVYRGQNPAPDYQLTWLDAQGKEIEKVGDPGIITNPRLSPDGNRVAYSKGGFKSGDSDIWVLDLKRNSTIRFTFGPGSNVYPVWSPDGSEIVFSSNRDGAYNLYRKPADGGRAEQLLLRSDKDKRALSWSRDMRLLLYGTSTRNALDEQMWVLPMQGPTQGAPNPFPFSSNRFDEGGGKFSPDGRWVAYLSNETGQYEVYVREFKGSSDSAGAGGKWIISKNGGFFPFWRADGKEIGYLNFDRNSIMGLSVDTTHSFEPGSPHKLIDLPTDRGTSSEVIATPDLQRFLMPVALETKVPQSFTVMLNWSSALKK